MKEAAGSFTSCRTCPWTATCAFTSRSYDPGFCLHEYKLLHAFLARRVRESPPVDAAGYARLADEARHMTAYLRRDRPFDPADPATVVPAGPSAPFSAPAGQANLMGFEPALTLTTPGA